MAGQASIINGRKGGRPKGTNAIAAEKAREYVIGRVVTELDPILTAQIESAKGIYVEETDAKGERIKVYQRLPDTTVGKYLTDQVAGKPRETVEVEIDATLKLDV